MRGGIPCESEQHPAACRHDCKCADHETYHRDPVLVSFSFGLELGGVHEETNGSGIVAGGVFENLQ